MTYLRELGFTETLGLDLSPDKLARAEAAGHRVRQADLHDLSRIPHSTFDVVYSSHCLEHCHDPVRVLSELKRIARLNATFVVVVPYPDQGPLDAHCGSELIGSRLNDNGESVLSWFEEQGLRTLSWRFDAFREPEIWLEMTRV